MNRDYKKGDVVIWIDKEASDYWKRSRGISLYGKIAKIMTFDKSENIYALKFKDWINSDILGNSYTKNGYGLESYKEGFKLAIDHLKFKKWIKGG